MQETIAKESPRRIGRRLGAAGMALAAVLTLGACKATGGGYVGDAPGRSVPPAYYSRSERNFGFNFTCEVRQRPRRGRDQGRDHLPRQRHQHHHGLGASCGRHGGENVPGDPAPRHSGPLIIFDVSTCEAAAAVFPDAAQFEGTYRPQDTTLSAMCGRFKVLVGDQGEPASSRGEFTGDLFSIELIGRAYGGYTRGGYIEGGNIQVDSK